MLENQFVELGTFNRLNPGKRVVRLIFGMALIAYFIWQLPKYGVLITTDFPLIPGKWIGVAILFYFFGDVFNLGFNRRWGRWPQYIFLILLGLAVFAVFIFYGTIWGPPAGWLIFLMQQFTALVIGMAFLLSAAFGDPWMRAQRYCPGTGQVVHYCAAHHGTRLTSQPVTALEGWESAKSKILFSASAPKKE